MIRDLPLTARDNITGLAIIGALLLVLVEEANGSVKLTV